MSLLQVQNISHAFDYLLFENVNFTLEPKESMAILGVSGSGKSTLLHICSTLLHPNHGEVILCDHNIYNDNDDARLKLRRYDVGIIFQSHYLFKGFFANENIELASFISDKKIDNGILERLGIADFMHYRVGDLSGGQQQRVSIARVLAKKPRIIFADEPTGNLDDKTAQEVMNVLFEYIEKENAALLLVTHNQQLAKQCTYMKHLHLDGLKEDA
ncbi:ABC transporter ATP-binding protein [Sulfurospirillum diekertiae]|uniref:ABC transporter ATP-binding protein n=1 Tax=Sulfurospirillum diekertiae TaxID=1854492 RepID=A0A290HAQ8_9BACT|nr:ABC transporter ATP-binding protein [Sulfurospirillum diekertiae]ATB68642.1 putative lipoprotein releasing system, ATPase [Sulfurospirillum diekertiae]QIR76476.1 ABC transporter ATP-binding protein [Sulfurospirillum diekertiae]QIR79105.1 ABC transporter ATP-binding protein [Sulfurospirillum diekertiae]